MRNYFPFLSVNLLYHNIFVRCNFQSELLFFVWTLHPTYLCSFRTLLLHRGVDSGRMSSLLPLQRGCSFCGELAGSTVHASQCIQWELYLKTRQKSKKGGTYIVTHGAVHMEENIHKFTGRYKYRNEIYVYWERSIVHGMWLYTEGSKLTRGEVLIRKMR